MDAEKGKIKLPTSIPSSAFGPHVEMTIPDPKLAGCMHENSPFSN